MTDTRWFGDIYSKYKEAAIKKCLKRGLSIEDAEDAVHHICLTFLSKPRPQRDGATAYLTNSVELSSRSFNQKKVRNEITSSEYAIAHEYTPEVIAMRNQDLQLFQEYFDSLPSKYSRMLTSKVRGETVSEMRKQGQVASSAMLLLLAKRLRARPNLQFNTPDVDSNFTYKLERSDLESVFT